MNPLIIPHRELEPDTLHAMLVDFVTRDGTDYGEEEVSLSTRVGQIQRQLDGGQAVIVFDPDSESFNILPREPMLNGL